MNAKTIDSFTNQIVQGDCIEVMKQIPSESVDLVVTDPPYIVNYKSPVAKQFLRRVRGIPYLLVFDKNGKRIARITGLDIEKLDKALAKADSG